MSVTIGFDQAFDFNFDGLRSAISAVAPGDLITLTLTLDAGTATGQSQQQQQPQHGGLGSGSGFERRRRRQVVARGAVLDLGIEIIPGRAHGTSISQLPTDETLDSYQQPIDARAAGAVLVIQLEIVVAGGARGDTISYDNEFLLLSAA